MKRRFWTAEEDAILREMTAAGALAREVAAAVGRTFQSVYARRREIGALAGPENARAIRVAVCKAKRGKKNPHESAATRARKAEHMRALWQAMSPEERAARVARMAAANRSVDRRRKIGASVSEARLGWCPEPFREEYRRLCHGKRMTAAEARSLVEPKAKAWLATFEGTLWKVRTGRARVVPAAPISRPLATPYSLTGCSL